MAVGKWTVIDFISTLDNCLMIIQTIICAFDLLNIAQNCVLFNSGTTIIGCTTIRV